MVKLSKILSWVLDLFFPKVCVGCGEFGEYLCDNCAKKIVFLSFQICPNCEMKSVNGKLCRNCLNKRYFDQVIACTSYKQNPSVRKLILKFKYKFSREISDILGKILASQLKLFLRVPPNEKILVVPIPIHKVKLRKRGFNQAELLAKIVAKNFRKFSFCNCLLCHDLRISQAKLNGADRISNLKNSISVLPSSSKSLNNKFVLLVDDVVTTGSTLNECSKALKNAGARVVCAVVVARGGQKLLRLE